MNEFYTCKMFNFVQYHLNITMLHNIFFQFLFNFCEFDETNLKLLFKKYFFPCKMKAFTTK